MCYHLGMKLKDADIRPLLFDFLDERHGKVRTYEELYIGDCRADVYAVLPDRTVGFEIKSDADTYARLAKQTVFYDRYCDYCYAVVGGTHTKIAEHIPEHWGIITVSETDGIYALSELREPQKSPKVQTKYKLNLMWKRELSAILKNNGFPKYADKSRKFISDYLLKKLPEEELCIQIYDLLFERDYTVFEDQKPKKRVRNRMSSVRRGKRAARAKKK